MNNEKLEVYIKRVESLISSGAYEDAVEILNEVLKIDPKNMDALDYKGNALSRLGRFQEVLEVCDEILKIDPMNTAVLNNRRNILKKLNQFQETTKENFMKNICGKCFKEIKINKDHQKWCPCYNPSDIKTIGKENDSKIFFESNNDEIRENGKLSKADVKGLLFNNIKYMKKIPLGWAWLIVAIILAGIFFYWFGVRPGQIRKECYKHPGFSGYDSCLRKNGLEYDE